MTQLIITIISTFSLAQTSDQFCDFLLARASRDPNTFLKSKDTVAKVNELIAMRNINDDFLKLCKEGVDKKMTWEQFKKFAISKAKTFPDFFQPQYDGEYFRKYCGHRTTEAGVSGSHSGGNRSNEKTTFEFKPVISEHEYSKEVGAKK